MGVDSEVKDYNDTHRFVTYVHTVVNVPTRDLLAVETKVVLFCG